MNVRTTFVQNFVFKAPITKLYGELKIWDFSMIDKFNKMNIEIWRISSAQMCDYNNSCTIL